MRGFQNTSARLRWLGDGLKCVSVNTIQKENNGNVLTIQINFWSTEFRYGISHSLSTFGTIA